MKTQNCFAVVVVEGKEGEICHVQATNGRITRPDNRLMFQRVRLFIGKEQT